MSETLNQIRNRPRFKLITALSQEEYVERLRNFYKENRKDFSANINTEMATIKVRTQTDEYWKPRLSMRFETNPENQNTEIRGIFGPSSAVWTFFMFLYILFLVCFTMFISIFFVTKQINAPDFPWAIDVAIGSVIGAGLTYLASWIGRNKAKEEMQKLRDFAERSVQGSRG